ncbi:MAG: MmgE/PrpD family protein, partial [Burkholderiaceae bacterium]
CRHTHPAADALLQLMQAHHLKAGELARVVTHVHQGAIDVLGPVTNPATVHQSKFSMGTVLALVARFGYAGLAEFDQHFDDAATRELRDRVSMELDAEVDHAYPRRWIGKVTVTTMDGRVLHGHVDDPKGDPGNTLSRDEITAKALRLATYSGAASPADMQIALDRLWTVAQWTKVGSLLSR